MSEQTFCPHGGTCCEAKTNDAVSKLDSPWTISLDFKLLRMSPLDPHSHLEALGRPFSAWPQRHLQLALEDPKAFRVNGRDWYLSPGWATPKLEVLLGVHRPRSPSALSVKVQMVWPDPS